MKAFQEKSIFLGYFKFETLWPVYQNEFKIIWLKKRKNTILQW